MESLNVTGKGSFGMRFGRLSLLVLSAALYQSASAAQGVYKQVNWPMQAKTIIGTPSPWHFGQVVAVATTKDGNILVFHRGAHPIMEFDPEGKFLRSWGDGMISEGKVTRELNRRTARRVRRAIPLFMGRPDATPAAPTRCASTPMGNIWMRGRRRSRAVYKMDTPKGA